MSDYRTDAISKGNCPPGYTLDPSDSSGWWCIKTTASAASPMASSSLSLSYLTSPVVGASSPLANAAASLPSLPSSASSASVADILPSLPSSTPSLTNILSSSAPSLSSFLASSPSFPPPMNTSELISSSAIGGPLSLDDKINHLVQAQDAMQQKIQQGIDMFQRVMSDPKMSNIVQKLMPLGQKIMGKFQNGSMLNRFSHMLNDRDRMGHRDRNSSGPWGHREGDRGRNKSRNMGNRGRNKSRNMGKMGRNKSRNMGKMGRNKSRNMGNRNRNKSRSMGKMGTRGRDKGMPMPVMEVPRPTVNRYNPDTTSFSKSMASPVLAMPAQRPMVAKPIAAKPNARPIARSIAKPIAKPIVQANNNTEANNAPANNTEANNAPANNTEANNAPANNAPANNAPANNAPANNTPANNTPANNAPANNAPANNAPANNAPANNAPANNQDGGMSRHRRNKHARRFSRSKR